MAVAEGFAEMYPQCRDSKCPGGAKWVVAPAGDTSYRVRLGEIGGMARFKGFHLIKCALMPSEFDNLSLMGVDLS
jgi:hypothetical protein